MKSYAVTIYVDVHDEAALIALARQTCEEDGVDAAETVTTVSDALRYIFDPGESPAGCQILDSAVDGADAGGL